MELPECFVCKVRGQWGMFRIYNETWTLCHEHMDRLKEQAIRFLEEARRGSSSALKPKGRKPGASEDEDVRAAPR